jgi:hypothetical protein
MKKTLSTKINCELRNSGSVCLCPLCINTNSRKKKGPNMKQFIKDLFRLPSTKAGRLRLAGLGVYTALSVVFPGIPQGIQVALKALSLVIGTDVGLNP